MSLYFCTRKSTVIFAVHCVLISVKVRNCNQRSCDILCIDECKFIAAGTWLSASINSFARIDRSKVQMSQEMHILSLHENYLLYEFQVVAKVELLAHWEKLFHLSFIQMYVSLSNTGSTLKFITLSEWLLHQLSIFWLLILDSYHYNTVTVCTYFVLNAVISH